MRSSYCIANAPSPAEMREVVISVFRDSVSASCFIRFCRLASTRWENFFQFALFSAHFTGSGFVRNALSFNDEK